MKEEPITHFERTFEKDLSRIRERLTHMAGLGERALRNCLQAFVENNRQLAYTVILADRSIDEMEREVDQLCLEFLVRQQPVARPLRFAYSTIRVNLELERIGDYAESIARQIVKLIGMNVQVDPARFQEIANLAIPMMHDAVHAFVTHDAELAKRTMRIEEEVDVLRNRINAELVELRQNEKIPLEALTPLMTIARRFERVSDQAKNICQEVIYSSTGEYTRHKGEHIYRLLFIDEHDACRAPMAAAIGNSFHQPNFIFSSAGLEPRPLDPGTKSFLRGKAIDLTSHQPRAVAELKDVEEYHVIIGLAKEVQKQLPAGRPKTVYLDWSLASPCGNGAPDAYEKAYQELHAHLHDLMEAIVGDKIT